MPAIDSKTAHVNSNSKNTVHIKNNIIIMINENEYHVIFKGHERAGEMDFYQRIHEIHAYLSAQNAFH